MNISCVQYCLHLWVEGVKISSVLTRYPFLAALWSFLFIFTTFFITSCFHIILPFSLLSFPFSSFLISFSFPFLSFPFPFLVSLTTLPPNPFFLMWTDLKQDAPTVELDWTGLNLSEPDWSDVNWFEAGCIPTITSLDRVELCWTGFNRCELNWSRNNLLEFDCLVLLNRVEPMWNVLKQYEPTRTRLNMQGWTVLDRVELIYDLTWSRVSLRTRLNSRLNQCDLFWSRMNLLELDWTWVELCWTELSQCELIWSREPTRSRLDSVELCWTGLNQCDLIWSSMNLLDWSRLNCVEPGWANVIWWTYYRTRLDSFELCWTGMNYCDLFWSSPNLLEFAG